MSRATPQMRSIALLLIGYEAASGGSSETTNPATFQVTDRLRPHLAMLMGNGGFRALLARALVLAGAEVSWLRAVQVNADGALEALELHREDRVSLGRAAELSRHRWQHSWISLRSMAFPLRYSFEDLELPCGL